MKSSIEQISRIILVVGLITLSISVLIAAVIPNILHAYLIANPSSFEHSILSPNMTVPYVLTVIEIVVGVGGLLFSNKKSEK